MKNLHLFENKSMQNRPPGETCAVPFRRNWPNGLDWAAAASGLWLRRTALRCSTMKFGCESRQENHCGAAFQGIRGL